MACGEPQVLTKRLSFRQPPENIQKENKGVFRIIVFADLMLSSDEGNNTQTLAFMDSALSAYNRTDQKQYNYFPDTDLIVILGNAVNGTDWDGKDPNYF